jgi:peptidoglycan/LPS O-acetylase OafA/YrhL
LRIKQNRDHQREVSFNVRRSHSPFVHVFDLAVALLLPTDQNLYWSDCLGSRAIASHALRRNFERKGRPVTSHVARTQYNYAIGYLRAFIVLLVVAHHTALAWVPYAPAPASDLLAPPRAWLAIPVVDRVRWVPTLPFVAFNDVFFMSLMFFLSGLFFWQGLKRRGLVRFLRDRAIRLGLPLLVAITLVSAAAYYPSYLQTTTHTGFSGFCHQWAALGFLPTGPAWFVAILLAFDCVAAVVLTLLPAAMRALTTSTRHLSRSPLIFFSVLLATSALVYIPMAIVFTPTRWSAFGPFAFQTSRIFHYFVYFLFAVGIGSTGLDDGLLARHGRLASQWVIWLLRAAAAFVAEYLVSGLAMVHPSLATSLISNFAWTLSCAVSCFACLALFLRFADTPRPWADSLAQNSYAIYLLHYMFVTWLQYAVTVTGLQMPWLESVAIFVCAAALTWLAAIRIRSIPGVARVV